MTSPAVPDPRLCPRCGQANACAQTQPGARPDTPCWCRDVQVPRSLGGGEDPSLWGPACFCAACVRAAQQQEQQQEQQHPSSPTALGTRAP